MHTLVLSRARTLQWGSALIAVCYHVRFLLFADYGHVPHGGVALRAFYFFTSLGHEAFLVYMGASGLLFGALSLPRGRAGGAAALNGLAARLRSLYWLLVPALLVGGLLDAAGSSVFAASGVYAMVPQFRPAHLSLHTLAGNLFLMQDVAVQGYGSNAMLFLLTYEWWACAACAAFALGRASGRMVGLLAWLAVGGTMAWLAPACCGYLFAWLAGLAASRCGAWWRGRMAGWIGAACFAVAVVVSRTAGAHLAVIPAGLVPLGRGLLDVVVGLGVGAYLASLHDGWPARALPAWLQRLAPRLTPAVYAVHFPVMLFVVAAVSRLPGVALQAQPGVRGGAAFVLVVALVLLCAQAFAVAVAALRRWLGGVPARLLFQGIRVRAVRHGW